MENYEKIYESAVMELRRGTLILSVLSQLETPEYGYSLVQLLASKDMAIDQSTLYPLLRRLEKQGLLDSDWSVEESRPRKYYVLSEDGREFLAKLAVEWESIVETMHKLLENI
ncbi:MAG: helix-turn-helix transcriptional regulator [Clostridia bacterium]|nr:helix-turn-helix transcriptional regulator [Clostridia bacterium]